MANEVRPTVLASRREEAYFAFSELHRWVAEDDYQLGLFVMLLSLRLKGHYATKNPPPPAALYYMRYDVVQNTHVWHALRPFFIGGSSLSELVGTNYYTRLTPRDQALTLLARQRTLAPPKDFSAATDAMRNGQTFEDLFRSIFEALTKRKVREFGMGVATYDHLFAHSPDGLVEAKDRQRQRQHRQQQQQPPWYQDCDEDAATAATAAPDTDDASREDAAGTKSKKHLLTYDAFIEIKVHSRYSKPLATIPDLYLPQCLQGLLVHNVSTCYFVSGTYRPGELEGRYATVTIEEVTATEATLDWFRALLSAYAKTLRSEQEPLNCSGDGGDKGGDSDDNNRRPIGQRQLPSLPEHFFELQSQAQYYLSPSKVRRSIVEVEYDGMFRQAIQLQVDIERLLGSAQYNYWRRQPYYSRGQLTQRDQVQREQRLFRRVERIARDATLLDTKSPL
jgi:hypothetical protein